MALMMVSQGLTANDVLDPEKDFAFPESVVEMLHGDLGQPPGGWPKALQEKALKGTAPITVRPGALLAPADLEAVRAEAERTCQRSLRDEELASYLMYPRIFAEFAAMQRKYGPVSALPTHVFFYGMAAGDEIMIEIETGKVLVVVLQTIGEVDDEGHVKVFFELNGEPRVIRVPNRSVAAKILKRAARPTRATRRTSPRHFRV